MHLTVLRKIIGIYWEINVICTRILEIEENK
jgi:hypothetical protein